MKTRGYVAEAGGVANERCSAVGRVEAAGGVVRECLKTGGCITVCYGVAKERVSAVGGVEAAGRIVTECIQTVAVLESPVVLFKSAPAPVAVFASAVLANSVPAPMAVLKLL